jgi:hypothetical protein
MTTPGKILAPKPIRRSQNINGVKINISGFERLLAPKICHTPKPKRHFGFLAGHNLSDSEEVKFKKMKTFDSNLFLQDDTTFDEIVIMDFLEMKKNDNSASKSEILSILRSESTQYESMYRSANEEEEEFFNWEEPHTSVPPVRSQNPLYKNLERCSDSLLPEEMKEQISFKLFDLLHRTSDADYDQK